MPPPDISLGCTQCFVVWNMPLEVVKTLKVGGENQMAKQEGK